MEQVKKILVLGSKGMAGHMIRQVLLESGKFRVIDIARDELFFKPSFLFDISDLDKLNEVLEYESPDMVINCIGVLNEAAEADAEKSIFFNSYLPHYIANRCQKLIHISTDCVFNGKRGGYVESDIKDGIGLYAQTKALGEVNYGDHLTIRTSIIGPELKSDGIGLFHWFMNQEDSIKGYTRAYWSGVSTFQLAQFILRSLESEIYLRGLIHLTNNEKISKYDLLNVFSKVLDKAITILPYDQYQLDKSFKNTRPDVRTLNLTYEQMLIELAAFMEDHKDLYKQYYS
jgi:dTDP-4-dehydrorhamnose reductase